MQSKSTKPIQSKYVQVIATLFLTAAIVLLLTACEQLKRDKSWLIASQPQAQRDSIKVNSSRVAFEGKPTVIAAEMTKGNRTLTLRDQAGFPAWRGCGP
ncbi:MAG: hypothetical protein WA902_01125 [Thermosynechococcaceae cyanobacterium]